MTEHWPLTSGTYALYTENVNLEEPALAAKLRPMATYAKDGRIFAKQFAGPKDVVVNLAQRKYPEKPFNIPIDCLNNPIVPEYKRRCKNCNQIYVTEARNQRYCEACAEKMDQQKRRERNRRHYLKRRGQPHQN